MILLIDNYDSFVYNLYQQIAQFYPEVRVIRNDALSLAQISALNPKAIVLSPGPGRPEKAGICIELIKNYSGKIPLLGVCLGHQAMAVAFGGQVVAANEIVHGKTVPVFHYRQSIYKHMPLPFNAGRYHSLIVSKQELPTEFMVEAETHDGLIMGMRHRQHLTFGVQFHPESILTPDGTLLLKEFVYLI